MENLNNELDLIAKNNQIDLNNLNKNNVYNMKKMMSNIEMFRNKLPKDGESIEDNATPEEIDKYFLAISNTLVKLEKNGNEGLKALSNWNTLLEVFNRLSQACEYLFENTLNSDDLAAIYEDIDNLYTLVYDILDFLSNLDLEGTLDDIYTQLSDLYSKYDSVLMVLKSIEDILEGIIASPLILLAASDTFEITTDGATTLTFNLVFDGIDATEQIVPTDIIVDDFALNGLFIAEDEYTITDKHVTDFNKIQIVIELNDPVVLESFNGEVKTQMALLQCLCNTKIVSAGAAPCTVLVTIQAVDGETNIPYISNTYYIDLSIILNGAYLSPIIDYTINRAADEPTGYVESIDFNYPIHGKLVILEKYVGFVINTMATTSSGSDSDNVLVVNTIETNWNEDILTHVLNDISGSVNYLRAEEIKADADIVALRTDMTTAQTDINALQSNDGAIESNITTLQNDVNLLETDVAGLHTSLATTDSKVATLEVDMDNAQADINNAEMNISNIVEDLATTDAKVATAVFTVNNIPPDANGNVNVEGGGSGGDMSNYYTKPESDARFAPIVHSHSEYSLNTHDHNDVYAQLVHSRLEYAPTTHTHAIADVTNLQTELTSLDTRLDAVELKDSDYEKIANKGIANGYTPLDANNKVPLSFLNDSMVGNVKYLGLWDASTNSPALPATPTAQGEYYVTSVAGTQFSLEFQIGDWIIANGASWGKVDNTDAVSTVQGRTGNVTITKEDVGLTNVDDTSDLDKPVSTATQVALDAVNLEVDDHELRLVALEAGVLPEELTQIHPGAAIGSTTATLSQNAWDFEYLVWYSSSPSANDLVIWCRIHRGVTSDVSGSSIRSMTNTDAPTVQTHFVQGTISSDGLTLTKPSDAGSLGGYIVFADNVVPQTLDNGVTYKIYGYKSASNKPTVTSNEGGSVDADWITPTLGNNWVDYAGTTQPVGFRKTSDGTVLLHGAMKSGSLNGPVFTLPEGYRPASESFFAIATNTTGGFIGACKITTAGVVSITAGSTACVYMDGISFYAEQ